MFSPNIAFQSILFKQCTLEILNGALLKKNRLKSYIGWEHRDLNSALLQDFRDFRFLKSTSAIFDFYTKSIQIESRLSQCSSIIVNQDSIMMKKFIYFNQYRRICLFVSFLLDWGHTVQSKNIFRSHTGTGTIRVQNQHFHRFHLGSINIEPLIFGIFFKEIENRSTSRATQDNTKKQQHAKNYQVARLCDVF